MAKEARSHQYTALFISVWDLREHTRNKVLWDEEMYLADRCRQVDLLVLDGLTLDDREEHIVGGKFIEHLLRVRNGNRLPTVITSSMTRAQLISWSGLQQQILAGAAALEVTGTNFYEAQYTQRQQEVFGKTG